MLLQRSGSYIEAAFIEVKKIGDNEYEYVIPEKDKETFWKTPTGTIEELVAWAQDYVYTSLTGPSGCKIWVNIVS